MLDLQETNYTIHSLSVEHVMLSSLSILNKIKFLLKVFVAGFPERIYYLRFALCNSVPQR